MQQTADNAADSSRAAKLPNSIMKTFFGILHRNAEVAFECLRMPAFVTKNAHSNVLRMYSRCRFQKPRNAHAAFKCRHSRHECAFECPFLAPVEGSTPWWSTLVVVEASTGARSRHSNDIRALNASIRMSNVHSWVSGIGTSNTFVEGLYT